MTEFYQLDVADVLSQLETDAKTGLSPADVIKRQAQYGKNKLPVAAGTNWIALIVNQFTDLMVIILIIAAIVSFFLGDSKDVVIILAIVILNAILGAYQEFRAEQALAALSAMQVPVVRVRRGGKVREISAEDLVPGDIVVLGEGDSIPADGRLIESVNLQIEEAALTGESQPVSKNTAKLPADEDVAVGDRSNMVFMGTAVNYGRGEFVVTATGLKTELGNIAALLMQVEKSETPLQRRINQLGQILAVGAGIIVALVFIAGVLRGIPVPDMFLISISLAVAAIPEGLPALITIGLSLGAGRMIKRNVLIRRLPAVETLGSVTTICSDKTGTLTKNEMTVTRIVIPGYPHIDVSGIGYQPVGEFHENGTKIDPDNNVAVKRFLKAALLATDAHLQKSDANGNFSILGDTTEGALIVAARKAGWSREEAEVSMPRVSELPFSSERKAMTTIHNSDSDEAKILFFKHPVVAITKGAPDRLIEWSTYELTPNGDIPLTDERRQEWIAQVDELAKDGLRVLGLAYRPLDKTPNEISPEIERDLHLLGLVGILDPARPEARAAVQTAREAGIRTVMITGDHALTAETIARDLGILEADKHAVTGTQLDKMTAAEFAEAARTVNTFARVSPQHKLQLVRELQKQNQIVAMTGDGVNDAPALKQADIGVAMGITGTDVSKGAAEMILVDDNFKSIVAAVEEGRVIYDNIRKFIRYLMSSNIGEILVIFVALLIGLKVPLLAIHVLWINLVTDGLPAIALGFEPAEEGVMKRKPRPPQESIFAGGMVRHIIYVAILLAGLSLVTYFYGFTEHGMKPFSDTLNLETFTAEELAELVDEEFIPTNWDSMSIEERIELLLEENGGAGLEEEGQENIISQAIRTPRSLAFTILALGQIFHVAAIHAGQESFFKNRFRRNRILLIAFISTITLQLSVVYVPFMRTVFETRALSVTELIVVFAGAIAVLLAVEAEKYFFSYK
ncbi:MAG: hypothetical protein CUN54_01580 [Phototrophicales bacterium]|nr:MAG: hypothetical protein CUN54_01580 [Phototrophicales bacterium]